jgi:hypothetical protein
MAVLQVLQVVAHGALQQDEQQVPDAEHSGVAASDKANKRDRNTGIRME